MANMDKQEIAAFNSKITPYVGENISGTQVNTLLQYCLSVNMSANQSGNTDQIINVKGVTELNGKSSSYKRVETGSNKFYTVEAKTNPKTGLMTDIEIKNH